MRMEVYQIEGMSVVDDYYGFVKRYLDNSLEACFYYLRCCSSISKSKPYFRAGLPVEFYRVFKRASQLGLLSFVDIERINSTYEETPQELETLVSWLILIEELAREN